MIKKFLIRIIKLYQKYLSPMKRTKCPYIPTCSQYGLEAIEKYGALKGGSCCAVSVCRMFLRLADCRQSASGS